MQVRQLSLTLQAQYRLHYYMNNIKRIVLTGGPCAGKTTALVKIIDHFSSLGFKVFTIPEIPTLFLQGGMDYLTSNRKFFITGEKATLQTQLFLEDKFMEMACSSGSKAFIVCDRGTMDISAYMDESLWQDITKAVGTDNSQLFQRYDAVLHLVSAADGAEEFYTTANNKQRSEGLEGARRLDKRITEAWTGHPHLRVINNHENFDNKIKRVIAEISNVLGLPQPIVEERKYIVTTQGDMPDTNISKITQTYLVSDPDCEVRLRKREWADKCIYVHTIKKQVSAKEQVETERQINHNLYDQLLRQADPYRHTITKIRNSFIWKGQFFELDTYQEPVSGLQILETKGITPQEQVNFPPFIKVEQDITGNPQYENYNIALGHR